MPCPQEGDERAVVGRDRPALQQAPVGVRGDAAPAGEGEHPCPTRCRISRQRGENGVEWKDAQLASALADQL